MKDLEMQVVLGSNGVIFTLGAKFKYRCRSEFASRIRWAIWSLLRRSVMLYNSLQDRFSLARCLIFDVFSFPST